jgi:BirA family transcriptional regulator, biotin operon repressor / biotin---[acetyl-CoA-carboxylase] ligase
MASVITLDAVDSTLDEIHRRAQEGAPPATVVVSVEQRAGRGSRGRTWHSPPGGLWFSQLLRPTEASAVEVLSLRVGLAVARTIESLAVAEPVRLKWPNDILLRDRKLGGILCEARWQGGRLAWVGVGVGLNVLNLLPDGLGATAIRLADVSPGVAPQDLVAPLAQRIAPLADLGPTLSSSELEAYHARDWLLGRTLTEPLEGIARGVSPAGELLIATPGGGLRAVRSGTVRVRT